MKQLLTLFRDNKFFRMAIIFGSLFLVLTLVLSPKKSVSPTPTPSPTRSATDTQGRPELEGFTEAKLKAASDYRSLIGDRLPIRVEKYRTSVGIDTSINIYFMQDDPASVVRFEIYGLSYLNKDGTPLSNPNLVAFQESFKEGLRLLTERAIDYKHLTFIYGDVEYVRETAKTWVEKYNLLSN